MAVKWGILGPGTIAHKFVRGLKVIEEAEIYATGSRSRQRAENFSKKYDITRSYGSYEKLVNDSEIDVIYVATPHTFHKEHSIMALESGKAVLCEKPFALNFEQAQEMVECARENRVFLMEAMWTRFLPVIKKVREWIKDGKIGKVRVLYADFGFRNEVDPESRLFDPELGGGSLLDVGIYTVSLASMIFGQPPQRIQALSDMGKTGVDEQTGILLGYDRGEIAHLLCAIRTSTQERAEIIGTEGIIEIPDFWHAKTATLISENGEEKVEIPLRASGYNYEAEEVMNCWKQGKLESKIMPLDESLEIMETMDKIREKINLKYPVE